jgi:Uma2 family endonuclease
MQTAPDLPLLRDLDDFWQWAVRQERRYEFVDGRIVAMAGGSLPHSTIQANIIAAVHPQLRGGPCIAQTSDALVRTQRVDGSGERGRYPDVTIRCEPENDRWIERPLILIEVLSDESAALDRGVKKDEYLALPSLMHYLLVEQDRARVELYSRVPGGWLYRSIEGGDAVVELDPPGLRLELAEIYLGTPSAALEPSASATSPSGG